MPSTVYSFTSLGILTNSIEKIDFSSFLACNILPVYGSYVTVPVNVYGQLLVFLSDLAVACTLLYWQIKNDDNDDGDDLQEKLLVRRHELHASRVRALLPQSHAERVGRTLQ